MKDRLTHSFVHAQPSNKAASSNADAKELSHFGGFAQQWWDKQGAFATLHTINPLRLEWMKRFCTLEQQNVLDVGCGGGILSEAMAQTGATVLGIDLAETALQAAQHHAEQGGVNNVRYQCISAEGLAREHAAKQAQQFDVVTCMEMLEHVPDPFSVVRACADLVKPDGWVFFSTIARSPQAFALAIVAAEYLLRLLPKGTHSYSKLIKPSELAAFARQAGLEVIATDGMHYNPVLKKASLTRSVDVNYFLACRKPS